MSALPLLTLPWWLDVFPQAMGHFSRNLGSVIADMVSDVNRTDRLIASEPMQATLATGERLVWRLQDSVYADTFGRFQFAQPIPRPVSIKAAMAVLTGKVTTQVRALDDAERAELFAKLAHAKEMGLKEMDQVFKPAGDRGGGRRERQHRIAARGKALSRDPVAASQLRLRLPRRLRRPGISPATRVSPRPSGTRARRPRRRPAPCTCRT